MHSSFKYDVFAFYAESDRQWTHKVLLPQLALQPSRIATRETPRPGEARLSAYEHLVENSRFTLLVLTPAFVNECWTDYVEKLAKHWNVESASTRVIPVRFKPVQVSLGIRMMVDVNFEDPANYEEAFATLRSLLETPEPPQQFIPCPYPGMLPFMPEQTDQFYGRLNETKKIIAKLRHGRRLFLIGPSGSGKSSLLQAGVLPGLRKSSLFTRGTWSVETLRPGSEPMASLLSALQHIFGTNGTGDVLHILAEGRLPTARLLLVLDQFEEAFTTGRKEKEFFSTLRALERDSRVFQLILLRADFYADLMESPLWEVKFSEREDIPPLKGDGLQEAIEQPALQCGVFVDPRVTERLMYEAADEPGVLPLLQETLNRLWDGLEFNYISLRSYNELTGAFTNGLAGIFSDIADSIVDELDPVQQQIARRIFLGLVQEGQGRPDTRRQRPVDDLQTALDDPSVFNATVQYLAKRRLVTLSSEHGQRRIDLAHEALIATWARLHKWLSLYREGQAIRERLEVKAAEWIRLGRVGGLLDRYELEEAKHWLEDPLSAEIGFSKRLLDLVGESARALEEQERRETLAAQQKAEAERQRAEEERRLRFRNLALALALQARHATDNRERSLLLARQAYLFAVRGVPGIVDQVDAALRGVLETAETLIPLRGPQDSCVTGLCFSPDGSLLLAAYNPTERPSSYPQKRPSAVYLWNLSQQHLVIFPKSRKTLFNGEVCSFSIGVQSICFSSDGTLFAVLDDSGEASIFSVSPDGSPPRLTTKRSGLPKIDVESYFSRGGSQPIRQRIRFTNSGELIHDGDEYQSESARILIDRYNLQISRSFSVRGMRPQMNHIAASPDGKHLVYDQHALPGTALYICKLDSPEPWIGPIRPGPAAAIGFSADSRTAYIVAGRCSALDISVWPPVQVPCRSPDFETSTQTLVAGSLDGIGLASGFESGKVWLSRRIPESTSPVVCRFPADCESVALSVDGSSVVAWIPGPESAETPAAHRQGIELYHAGITSQVATLRSEIAETAHELCGIYYRNANTYNQNRTPLLAKPTDAFFWLNAERLLRIRHSLSALAVPDGRAARLARRIGDTGILIEYQLEYPRAIGHTLYEMSEGEFPLSLGNRGDLAWSFAIQSRDGVAVCDARGNRYAAFNLAFSSSLSHKQALWGAFSPGARLFAFQNASFGWLGRLEIGAVMICDLESSQSKPQALAQSSLVFTAVAFDALGTRIALGLTDTRVEAAWQGSHSGESEHAFVNGSVLVYELANPAAPPMVLSGGVGDVTALSFSPDSTLVAAGGSNGSITVYDAANPQLPLYLRGHSGPVLSLRFTGDGSVVSTSYDRTARMWIVNPADLADLVNKRVSRNLSQSEWDYYVGPGIDYERTCSNLN